MSTSPVSAFEIKSAELSLVALWLRTTDLGVLAAGLQAQWADTPGFFDHDPVLVDLSELPQDPTQTPPDFKTLADLLATHQLQLVAFRGAQKHWREAALKAGLVDGSDARIRALQSLETSAVSSRNPKNSPAPAVNVLESTALVIDKPLRSGQQVYAKGRDLVVMAMVNPGAEVIADGNIHVYAPLRGKAIAGARGLSSARIFALGMEAQLLSIAGVYRTSENPLPADILGRPGTVRLQSGPDGDRLLIEALQS